MGMARFLLHEDQEAVMNLRRKMLLGYGFAFAMLALVMGWSVERLSALGRASDSILQQNYRSIDASWRMREALHRQDEALLSDTSGFPGRDACFTLAEADFLFWLGRARDNITVPGEDSVVARISALYPVYLDSCESFGRMPAGLEPPARFAVTIAPVSAGLDSTLGELLSLNQQAMHEASRRASDMAGSGSRSTMIIGGFGLAFGIAFSILLSGRILRPLYQTIAAARRLASGDYESRVPGGGSDELGSLAAEFNSMAGELEKFESMHVDRMLSEKSKTEAILNGIDDGIILVDPDMRVQDMNPAASSMLGATRAGHSRRPHLSELIHDESLLSEAARVLDGAGPRVLTEDERIIGIDRNGVKLFLLVSAIPLEHSGRSIPGCVVVLRDVTRAREIDRMKSEFVMAAAHELRTPVTSIGMSIDLLVDHCRADLGPRERELLEAAHDEIHRLKALIGDLLDLSRMEAGRIDLEIETVPVQLLFERIRGIYEGQLARKGSTIATGVTEPGLAVSADPGKISWVLSNLVSNALRYIPEGSGRISLDAKRAGDDVILSVSDNGPGIPLERQTGIFQKFVHFDVQDKAGGSGLGLAICREVVRASGGTIWVESEPGEGAVFSFTLPASPGNGGHA